MYNFVELLCVCTFERSFKTHTINTWKKSSCRVELSSYIWMYRERERETQRILHHNQCVSTPTQVEFLTPWSRGSSESDPAPVPAEEHAWHLIESSAARAHFLQLRGDEQVRRASATPIFHPPTPIFRPASPQRPVRLFAFTSRRTYVLHVNYIRAPRRLRGSDYFSQGVGEVGVGWGWLSFPPFFAFSRENPRC